MGVRMVILNYKTYCLMYLREVDSLDNFIKNFKNILFKKGE